MPHTTAGLKQTLRGLRRLELQLRYRGLPETAQPPLVWDVFFSTNPYDERVKYPLGHLLSLNRDTFKAVIDDYFYRVYFEHYQDRGGFSRADIYDADLLAILGLPPHAGSEEVKKRFRELAKRYHPDRGGDKEQFIALMAAYEKLTKEE